MKVNLSYPWGNLTTPSSISAVSLYLIEVAGCKYSICYLLILFYPRAVTQICLPLISNFVCSPVLLVLQPTPTWMTSANSCAAQATPISLEPNDRRITQRAISRGFPLVPPLLVWSLGGCALTIYTTKWALTSFGTFAVILSTVFFVIHFKISCFNRYVLVNVCPLGVCIPSTRAPQHSTGQPSSHAVCVPLLQPIHTAHPTGQDEGDSWQIFPWQLGKIIFSIKVTAIPVIACQRSRNWRTPFISDISCLCSSSWTIADFSNGLIAYHFVTCRLSVFTWGSQWTWWRHGNHTKLLRLPSTTP